VKDQKDKSLFSYFEEFKKPKSSHPSIQNIIDNHSRILEQLKVPITQSLKNISIIHGEIQSELSDEEFGLVYSNIKLLSDTFPNYDREQKNLLTLYSILINNTVVYVKELVEGTNEIEAKVIQEPIAKKESEETEEENDISPSSENSELKQKLSESIGEPILEKQSEEKEQEKFEEEDKK